MPLFRDEPFTSHAGLRLNWKIDCDALTPDDMRTLATIISAQLTFHSVIGIPRGGLRLAEALQPHINASGEYALIVDDVYTTGTSMHEALWEYLHKSEVSQESSVRGIVIFARRPAPNWILPVFTLNPDLRY